MALIDVLDRVEGELGPVKSNDPAHPFNDPTHQLAAAEWNTAAEAIIALQQGHNAQEAALSLLGYAPVEHATNANVSNGQAALFLLASGSRTATIISPSVGARVLVKINGNTSGNTVTVDPAGGATVDGASSLVLSQDNEAVELLCVANNEVAEWVVMSRAIIPVEGGGGGGDGGILGPGSTEVGKLVVWDSVDGTLVSQDSNYLTWDGTALTFPVLHMPSLPSPPGFAPSGGFVYSQEDGLGGTGLHYQNSTSLITPITSPQGHLIGTASRQATTSSDTTAYDGDFLQVDLASAGMDVTITLDAAAPIGSHLVVKLMGAAGGFEIDVVDGAAQTIDGAATYTLTTDYQAARLTKLSDGTWAVG